MKVTNMISPRTGKPVANQYIIENGLMETFQSYDSVIAVKEWADSDNPVITLDQKYWDYSQTTGKYRNIFLGETKKETQAKIDDSVYKLADLNK